MNQTNSNSFGWVEALKNQFHDGWVLLLTVLLGTFIKIYKEPNNPKKWRFTRFIAEFLISFLIAVTLYQINTLWLGFPKLFLMTLCVWSGALSGQIYHQVEELLDWSFKQLKQFFSNSK
jgi:hypothetical protein